MKTLILAVMAASLLFGTAVAQDDAAQVERAMKIQVITGDSDDDGFTLDWTSSDPDMDLENMQIGESRSFVDDDGRSIVVTKQEDGMSFNVDGETVVMPHFENAHTTSIAMVSADGVAAVDHDVDVQVVGGGHMMASPVTDGVMIVTKDPLDAATQESIRAVLQSAGNTDEITFVDRGGADQHVKVVRKTIEIKQ